MIRFVENVSWTEKKDWWCTIYITERQAQSLRKIIPDEAERLIASNDAMAILDALDDVYIMQLDLNDEPTAAGRECEKLRDEIHWDNFHKD